MDVDETLVSHAAPFSSVLAQASWEKFIHESLKKKSGSFASPPAYLQAQNRAGINHFAKLQWGSIPL
ncbi:hypothetical protein CRENBAI_023220 [Crenichthys baileyi]|uniref:Uncharacterized protein n=1 Tax=Crenichthys baileyi TaxID=28760 RepID=A0AAV9S316_9TELE